LVFHQAREKQKSKIPAIRDTWEPLQLQITMQKILCLYLLLIGASHAEITLNRRSKIVKSLNVRRNVSSDSTPLQVGNGNFAFGADITGLQTFAPFAIMSTWAWHNFSLPTTTGQTSPDGKTLVHFLPILEKLLTPMRLYGA
jgi:hypothetical protein